MLFIIVSSYAGSVFLQVVIVFCRKISLYKPHVRLNAAHIASKLVYHTIGQFLQTVMKSTKVQTLGGVGAHHSTTNILPHMYRVDV